MRLKRIVSLFCFLSAFNANAIEYTILTSQLSIFHYISYYYELAFAENGLITEIKEYEVDSAEFFDEFLDSRTLPSSFPKKLINHFIVEDAGDEVLVFNKEKNMAIVKIFHLMDPFRLQHASSLNATRPFCTKINNKNGSYFNYMENNVMSSFQVTEEEKPRIDQTEFAKGVILSVLANAREQFSREIIVFNYKKDWHIDAQTFVINREILELTDDSFDSLVQEVIPKPKQDFEIIPGGIPATTYEATSAYPEGDFVYEAKYLASADDNLPWVENDPEYGIGEKLELSWKEKIYGLVFYNGFWDINRKLLYTKNSRVKKIKVTYNDKSEIFNIQDYASEQVLFFFEPTKKVTVEILEVYTRSEWKDTCINSIQGLSQQDYQAFMN